MIGREVVYNTDSILTRERPLSFSFEDTGEVHKS